MLDPDQFDINEAWIAFKLNEEPVRTSQDGLFDCMALMDAASCFILTTQLVPLNAAGVSALEAKRLLKDAAAHKKQLPKTLFVGQQQPAENLIVEAERQKIAVVRVSEDQLLVFVGEAIEGFTEHVSGAKRGIGSSNIPTLGVGAYRA